MREGEGEVRLEDLCAVVVWEEPVGGGEGNEMEGIRTVENLILTHAVWIPVTAEADYDEAVLFGHLHSRLV